MYERISPTLQGKIGGFDQSAMYIAPFIFFILEKNKGTDIYVEWKKKATGSTVMNLMLSKPGKDLKNFVK